MAFADLAFSSTGSDRLLWSAPDPRRSPLSTAKNPFAFQGLPHDPETGLLYVRHRYLDPELGRFLSDDPNLYMDSGNAGQFALHNPLELADPLGLVVLGYASARESAAFASYSLFDPAGQPSPTFAFVAAAGDRLVTFLHGYNVDFGRFRHLWLENFNQGFEQVGRGQPIHGFTWKGDIFDTWPLSKLNFAFFGTAERNAQMSGVAFAKYLGDLRAAGGKGMDLFAVTHSLGARVALQGLNLISAWRGTTMMLNEYGRSHYSQDLDGLFMFNAAVPRSSLYAGGEFESSLSVARTTANFYSAADSTLGRAFHYRKWHVALGSREIGTRVSPFAKSYKEFNLLNSEIAGSPACTHSNHLLPTTWPYEGPGGRPECTGAGFEHRRLFSFLAERLNEAARVSWR